MYDNLKPSYEEIHNACKEIALKVQGSNLPITRIGGVSRGGLLPAVILSHLLKLPLILIDYSSLEGKGDDKNHHNVLPELKPEGGALLIVDDICDSGKTLNELVFHYTRCNITTYTAALYYKTHDSQPMIPDFVWRTIPHDSGWVIFPYERDEFLMPDTNGPTRYLKSLVRD
jgi:hypoxanthine phosphoribosyltransferase